MKIKILLIRLSFLLLILLAGAVLTVVIYKKKIQTQYDSTLAPAFQLFGGTTKTVNRIFSRAIPVDEVDEREFGNEIAKRYDENTDKDSPDYKYLNNLIINLSKYKKKPFKYRVYPIDYDYPNAFAMPGGVILVTTGLLGSLETEGELVSILAHEMGHIELSHCFDLVRFELLTKKIGDESIGWLADFAINLLLRDSFSKTMENEADEFAFDLVKKTKYDPMSLADSFKRLEEYVEKNYYYNDDEEKHADPVRDYFMSHPPLKLRIEKFSSDAVVWWRMHSKEKRYLGKLNLKERISYYIKDFGIEEWITKN